MPLAMPRGHFLPYDPTTINRESSEVDAPMDDPRYSPFGREMRGAGADYYGRFPELWEEYSRIQEEGFWTPEQMATAQAGYRGMMQPELGRRRGAVGRDVGRRMGARSGASAKAMYNLVDVPFEQEMSDFAQKMYMANLQSMQEGLGARGALWQSLAGQQMGYAGIAAQREAMMRGEKGGGFGFGDILDLGARGLGAYFGARG